MAASAQRQTQRPWRRIAQALAPFLLLALLWQIASFYLPRYLFPSLVDIFAHTIAIFSDVTQLGEVLATVGRILAGLIGAFLIGAVIATLMARMATFDRFLGPILNFFQGIPALSWVVFAIIWFHGTEPRIFFIMTVTALPAFTFQILDALRGMSKDLIEMVMSFRPTRAKLF
ncbi:MAG: hypothetical protein JO000_02260, partial [Alphaproteobacteria bacterium]|nr:hypothetical protein [Alphaproteobacteria bacterium]